MTAERRKGRGKGALDSTKAAKPNPKRAVDDTVLRAAETQLGTQRERDRKARTQAREREEKWALVRAAVEQARDAEYEDAGSDANSNSRRITRWFKVGRAIRKALGDGCLHEIKLPEHRAYAVVHECFRMVVDADERESDSAVRDRVMLALRRLEPGRPPALYIAYFGAVLVHLRRVVFPPRQSGTIASGAEGFQAKDVVTDSSMLRPKPVPATHSSELEPVAGFTAQHTLTDPADLDRTESGILDVLRKATAAGGGVTLRQLLKKLDLGSPSSVYRGIVRLHKLGYRIENRGGARGYFMAGDRMQGPYVPIRREKRRQTPEKRA